MSRQQTNNRRIMTLSLAKVQLKIGKQVKHRQLKKGMLKKSRFQKKSLRCMTSSGVWLLMPIMMAQ